MKLAQLNAPTVGLRPERPMFFAPSMGGHSAKSPYYSAPTRTSNDALFDKNSNRLGLPIADLVRLPGQIHNARLRTAQLGAKYRLDVLAAQDAARTKEEIFHSVQAQRELRTQLQGQMAIPVSMASFPGATTKKNFSQEFEHPLSSDQHSAQYTQKHPGEHHSAAKRGMYERLTDFLESPPKGEDPVVKKYTRTELRKMNKSRLQSLARLRKLNLPKNTKKEVIVDALLD